MDGAINRPRPARAEERNIVALQTDNFQNLGISKCKLSPDLGDSRGGRERVLGEVLEEVLGELMPLLAGFGEIQLKRAPNPCCIIADHH